MPDDPTNDDDLVMDLVEAGLAQPESEREDFLRRSCAGNADLLREVSTRILSEVRMKGFLLDPLLGHAVTKPSFEAGELFAGRFRLVREIGQGGMGVVYEAIDEKLERRIAIKCAKPGFQWRLPPEARNATGISHRNVCKIHEIHTTATPLGQLDFLTMEYLDGETLLDRIRRRGPLDVEQVRDIGRQICAGLEEAHRKGVIHGDLKSANIILVDGEDARTQAVITDFGLARSATAEASSGMQASPAGGTPAYMAPELWKGEKASMVSDLYALGVILFEALSGKLPGQEMKRVSKVVPHIPRQLDAIISRCLEPNPQRRPASASDVSTAIVSRHRIWVIARVAAVLLSGALVGVPVSREPARNGMRLALLPFEALPEQRSLAEATLRQTGELLAQVKPSGWRFSVVPLNGSARQGVKTAGQACRELAASHVLTGDLQRQAGAIAVRAAIVDACTQQVVKEFALEYSAGDEDRIAVALAGVVTASLRLPPVRPVETVRAAALADYSAGVKQQQQSRLDDAIRSFERAAGADRHSPMIWAALAEVYRLKFQSTNEARYEDSAEDAARRAESLNPDSAPVRRIRGTFRLDAGQYARAEEDFRRAIELEPQNPDGYIGLALADQKMDRPQDAFRAFFKAIDVAPRYPFSYKELGGFYYDLGQYDKAVDQLKKVVEINPNSPEGYVSLASPYIKLGQYAEAEKLLRKALALHETVGALTNLGAVLSYQQRFPEAIAQYQRAAELAPNDYLTWLNIGDNYRRTDLASEADRSYRHALDLTRLEVSRNPENAYVRALVGYLLARLGDDRQAEYEVRQALQMRPAEAQVMRVAARTYEALSEREKTLAVLKGAPRAVIDDLNRQPDMASLRADPLFKVFLTNHP